MQRPSSISMCDPDKIRRKKGDKVNLEKTDKNSELGEPSAVARQEYGNLSNDPASGGISADHMAGLPQAVSKLSGKKARTEAAFQAGRKRHIEERKTALCRVKIQGFAGEQVNSLHAKISEMRWQLREEIARKQEQSDHAAMPRWLQRRVSEERNLREILEDRLEAAVRKASRTDLAKEDDLNVEKLIEDLEDALERHFRLEKKLEQSYVLLTKLQKNLIEMSVYKSQSWIMERDMEEMFCLGGRQQDLFQEMETYDRFCTQDHVAIQEERRPHFTHGNRALASAAGISEHIEELSFEESSLPVKVLLDQLGKKHMLQKELKPRIKGHVDLIAYFQELAEKELL
ncbi:hypothetical protein HPB50_026478 [Hyalomma asiaticum]|uniref:Uncharacterized protein n=1 Tax=Hyalomma asiaticum TaxID=266040 RepID=A0ACB7T4G6_HYAAI|nr:hypothetical protein HPB50_026478 [Hyalomma asiaticum]